MSEGTYKCGHCIIGFHHKCILSFDSPSGHHLCNCGFGKPHEGPPKPKKIKDGAKPLTRKRAAAKTKAKPKKES